MSFDTRNNSAIIKRAEQLKRWEDSDTNRAPAVPKDPNTRKVKFSAGCVFLAACLSGDKEDILRLIENGVDIDTANVDGLTALHQACIDDNLDMVEFLVQHGADINKQDNEGWTPLHATASCGFLSIAQYLIENNADLAAVNSDGDLAIDLADSDRMHALLQKHLIEQGIDCDEARQIEEKMMLRDAENWLRSDASEADKPHPRTGATALHVAAAKGYNKVLGLLLATRADVDKQDNDGWTPLHAAARWGQKEAAQMLIASLADMDVKNYAGQTPIDVADPSIVKFLEDLYKNNKRTAKRRPASQIRISDNIYNHIMETPQKVIRVEVKSDAKALDDENIKPPTEPAPPTPKENNVNEDDAPWRRPTTIRSRAQLDTPAKIQIPEKEVNPSESEVMLRRTQSFENDEKFYQKYLELRRRINAHSCPVLPATISTGIIGVNSNSTTNNYSVQRSASLKDHKPLSRSSALPPTGSTNATSPTTITPTTISNLTSTAAATTTSTTTMAAVTTTVQSGPLRSYAKGDEVAKPKFSSVTNLSVSPEVSSKINQARSVFGGSAFTLNKIHDRPLTPGRNASSATDLTENNGDTKITNDNKTQNETNKNPKPKSPIKFADELKVITANNEPASKNRSKFFPGHLFKNFFKSFVPPARDEESETQRKAHAKRVRETRRSTQGVTLEEIKSAEELVKKKNQNNNKNDNTPTTTTITINALDDDNTNATTTTTTTTTTIISPNGSSGNTNSSDQITASYTIVAPSNSIQNSSSNLLDEEKVTSFTISPPPLPQTQPPPATTTAAVTINVPSTPSTATKKTDSDVLLTQTSPTTNVQTSFNFHKTTADSNQKSSTENQMSPTKDSSNATLPVTDDDKNDKINITNTKLISKRSLFDIDNANSLSLADKLRNEANKYAEIAPNNNQDNDKLGRKNDSSPTSPSSPPISTTTAAATATLLGTERRPSWRLKFDAGSKFKLEDASTASANADTTTTNSTANRKINNLSATNTTARPVSAPIISSASTENFTDRSKNNVVVSDVTLSLRKNRNTEDKENDKENDSRGAQTTQTIIQRRRRPKRRSTGVCTVEDADNDKDSPVDGDESGSEKTSTRSRLGSTSSATSEQSPTTDASENGELIDYKALYEAVKAENDKLRVQLKKKDDEVVSTKAAIERFTNATTKNSLTELEKREKRAMERKISEMEEELKQLQKFKQENERLRAENRALTRVVSKLTISAQNQLQNRK